MKTIGLVGGTGWVSTVEYYRTINEETNRILGALNFAKCILYSLDYGEIEEFNKRDDMEGIFSLILDASKKLVSIGADCIVLCANTLHMFADRLQKEVPVPLIHIAIATARQIKGRNLSKVGLLGTKLTMEKDFYKTKLNQERIEVVVPELPDREFIDHTITNELLKGIKSETSKDRFLVIMRKLRSQGAEGIVLGCTEIPLLIQQEDTDLPVFNTTVIHSLAAVEFALGSA
jgi:aspartate racemase